jgi:hypothetical protein
MSFQLLKWLTEMKNIWRDFPVSNLKQDSKESLKFFSFCDKNENFPNQNFDGVLSLEKSHRDCFSKFGISKLNGSFVGGNLNGMATIHFANGSLIRAPFDNGSLSGLVRKFSCLYGSCDFDYEAWNVPNRLAEVCFVQTIDLFWLYSMCTFAKLS